MENKLYIYKQIENYLMDLIRKNENTPSYKLPSEMQIMTKFGASRITVRKAFAVLEKKNIVYRVKAKGTFINKEKETRKLDFLENICFIIPNTVTRFCNSLIEGAKAFCTENRINLLLGITDNDMGMESAVIENFIALGCKGLLVTPSDYGFYNEKLMELSLKKFPVVLVDKVLKRLNLSSVSSNHYKAMSDVMQELYNKNHKKITYVTKSSDSSSSVADRNRAYEKALLSFYGSITSENFIYLDNSPSPQKIESVFADAFKANKPDVIIINSGEIGMLLFKTLRALGYNLSSDFTFVFFDDEFAELAPMLDLKAYTIIQDTYHIGYLAAQQLYQQMFFGAAPQILRLDAKITK